MFLTRYLVVTDTLDWWITFASIEMILLHEEHIPWYTMELKGNLGKRLTCFYRGCVY